MPCRNVSSRLFQQRPHPGRLLGASLRRFVEHHARLGLEAPAANLAMDVKHIKTAKQQIRHNNTMIYIQTAGIVSMQSC
eukprot:scaffold682493_cov57-Prasinocladus_malaysianus.AAC.1